MVTKVQGNKIILDFDWGGRLVLSLSGARQFVQTLLELIEKAESEQLAQKQL